MQIDHNKTAVITGAASGMGLATAQSLQAQGCQVVLLDVNQAALEEVGQALKCQSYVCDVSDADSVTNVFAEIKETLGTIHICVNCAGIAPAKRVVGREGPMPLEAFVETVQINLIGSFNVARIAAYHMSGQAELDDAERGVIIFTASVAAYEGQIGQAAYSASKGGIVGMTLPIARELAQFGVRVMTIAPGLIATPMLLGMPQAVQDSLAASVPFPKRLGMPKEYAHLVETIITNPLLNGSVIRLDGAIRMAAK